MKHDPNGLLSTLHIYHQTKSELTEQYKKFNKNINKTIGISENCTENNNFRKLAIDNLLEFFITLPTLQRNS